MPGLCATVSRTIGSNQSATAPAGTITPASAAPSGTRSRRASSARAPRKPASTITTSAACGGWISVSAPAAAATDASPGQDGRRTYANTSASNAGKTSIRLAFAAKASEIEKLLSESVN